MVKSYTIELKGVTRRSDRSVKFNTESLVEISSEDMGILDSMIGGIGILAVTDNSNGLGEEDMKQVEEAVKLMPERDTFEKKTLSQQLRGVLWIQLKQKLGKSPSTSEFADYYEKKMTAIINKIKETLE